MATGEQKGRFLLNDELSIQVPEGFHVMDESEVSAFKLFREAPNWSISNSNQHMVLTVSWKKSGFAALLLGAKDVAQKMEPQVRKAMEQYGYALEGFVTEELGGRKAEGFAYSYRAKDIDMVGETLSVKKGKTFCYIHCYMRESMREESRKILDEIFRAVRWEKG
ncbi:MAG: hypothetical protein Q4A32_02100 [Lachnospiraceae bacterium]|nr:hypothetical protein [Lachnospiraceae bacterium]